MRKWVVKFDSLKTVQILEDMNILSYKPILHDKLNFVFIQTDMSEEEILKIEGIISCRPEAIGTLKV